MTSHMAYITDCSIHLRRMYSAVWLSVQKMSPWSNWFIVLFKYFLTDLLPSFQFIMKMSEPVLKSPTIIKMFISPFNSCQYYLLHISW